MTTHTKDTIYRVVTFQIILITITQVMESSVLIDKRHSDRDVNKWFHESFKNSK